MAMTITMFDTHAAVEALIGKGVQKEQAEIFVRIVQESKDSELGKLASKEQVALLEKDFEHMKESVATKADLAEVKTELKTEMAEMKAELKAEISAVEKRLDEKIHNSERRLMIMIGTSGAAVCGIIIATLKYFIHT